METVFFEEIVALYNADNHEKKDDFYNFFNEESISNNDMLISLYNQSIGDIGEFRFAMELLKKYQEKGISQKYQNFLINFIQKVFNNWNNYSIDVQEFNFLYVDVLENQKELIVITIEITGKNYNNFEHKTFIINKLDDKLMK